MTKRTGLAGKDKLTSTTLLSDQRGAVAFEMLIVFSFIMFSLLLPLADVAIAGFRFISAWQALRDLGAYAQYHPPSDITDWSSWASSLPQVNAGYPISNIQVICGDTKTFCSSANTTLPRYYSYKTTVTLSPFNFLKPVLCRSSNADPCSFTLPYSERFQ